jgi:hypothetical protein
LPAAFEYARICEVSSADALHREHDVVGRERRAVVELDALAQLEAPRRRVELLPRRREARDDLEVLVPHHQRVVDQVVDVVGQVLVLRVRVHRLRVAATRPAQGLRVGDRRGGERGGEHGGDRDAREPGERGGGLRHGSSGGTAEWADHSVGRAGRVNREVYR